MSDRDPDARTAESSPFGAAMAFLRPLGAARAIELDGLGTALQTWIRGLGPPVTRVFCLRAADAGRALAGQEFDLALIGPGRAPVVTLLHLLPALRAGAWAVIERPSASAPGVSRGGSLGLDALEAAWPGEQRVAELGPARLVALRLPDPSGGAQHALVDLLARGFGVDMNCRELLEAVAPGRLEPPMGLIKLRALADRGRPIMIWGAGAAGRSSLALLKAAGLAPAALIDTDPAKHLAPIAGTTVLSPASIVAGAERPFVVIASLHANSIERELLAAGFDADDFMLASSALMPAPSAAPPEISDYVWGPEPRLSQAWRVALETRASSIAPVSEFVLGSFVREVLALSRTAGRRHLVLASHEASRTGAPLIALEIVRWLRRTANIDVTVLLGNTGPLAADFAAEAVVVDARGIARLAAAGDAGALLEAWLRDSRPDAVILNSAECWPFAGALQDSAIPVLTLMHEYPADYPPERLRGLFAASHRVAFPSAAMRQAAAQHAGVDIATLDLAPQGLLPGRSVAADRVDARRALRQELGVSPDSFVVLGCGVVGGRKGTDLFIAIAAQLEQQRSETPLIFAWLGPQDDTYAGMMHWIRADLVRLGIADRVFFLPERSDPSGCFAGADTFLLTSRQDPFPCVVHEAMSAGLPVVAFEGAGGAPEAIADGAGVIVPYGDVTAVADAVARLVADAEHRRAVGERARHRVRTTYDFDAYGRTLLALLGWEP